MNNKIRITVEIEVDQKVLKEANYNIQELAEDIEVYPEDIIDGYYITRKNDNYGRRDVSFFMGTQAKIVQKEVI